MKRDITYRQRLAQGTLAWERNDFEAALEIFDEVREEHPDFADIHNRIGLCHAMLGSWQEALEAFDRSLGLSPTYAEAHANRGIVLNELGRHAEARDAFERSAELDLRDGPELPSEVGNQIAVTHAKLGDLYLVADRPERAVEQYRAGLDVRPDYVDIRSKLGEALLDLGEVEKARAELERVLESNPDFWSARLRLGIALHRLGDAGGAVREWRICEEADPDDMRPKAFIANALGRSEGEPASGA